MEQDSLAFSIAFDSLWAYHLGNIKPVTREGALWFGKVLKEDRPSKHQRADTAPEILV